MDHFEGHKKLYIKSFDLNTKKTGSAGIPELCPADGFLIRYEQDGENMVILLDAGKKGQGDRVILPCLKALGISRIDYMILSHAHNDHFGGMIDILKAPRITVDEFIYSPIPDEIIKVSDDEENFLFWMELKQLIQEKPHQVRTISASDAGTRLLSNGELIFDIVSTPDESVLSESKPVNLNEFNLVLKLSHGRFSALFPGDCGPLQAERLLNSPERHLIESVTLLKASHHGGDESASPIFNRLCNAQIVLVTCNETVIVHRPSFIQNLHNFALNGAKLFRMDQLHDFEIETDGLVLTCHAESDTYNETSLFYL